MNDLKGYDEVFNLLLEHSFRYFGPSAEMTSKITENNTWSPQPSPDDNNLVKLIDPSLRESNEAYLNFSYIMDYYVFDSFLNKMKYEVENPKNSSLTPNQLFNLKFDEEEVRKVMGHIGQLLLKEPSLIGDQSSYDFLNLYFQIKKLWSIIITTRYLDEHVDVSLIKQRLSKSFTVKQLQEVERANSLMENFLVSFEDIFRSEETARKHIDEFLREYLLRYFQYIIIGLTHFQKDFLHSISTKFTSIDLIKEYSNAIHPEDAFHVTLIEFLRTNNLQTEKEIEQFIGLLEKQRSELLGVEQEENSTEPTGNDLADELEQSSLLEEPLQNDPNLNLLNSDEAPMNQNANDLNDQDQLNDFDIDPDNLTFGTIISSTQRDDQNNDNQLNESMNQENCMETNQLDVNQLENPIDDPYQQIDNMLSSNADQNGDRPAEDAGAFESGIESSIAGQPAGQGLSFSQPPDLTKVAKVIKESPSTQPARTEPSETNQTASTIDQAADSSDQVIIPLPASLEPVNTSSESLLNRSNSGSNLRKFTELTRLPVEKGDQPEEDNQIDLTAIQQSINNFENNSESEFELASNTPNYHDMTVSGEKHSEKTSAANESDELDDLGLGITVKETASRPIRPLMSNDFFDGPPIRIQNPSDIISNLLNSTPAKRANRADSTESEESADETLKKTQEPSRKKKIRGRPRKRVQSENSDSGNDSSIESSRRKKKSSKVERSSRRPMKKRVQTSEGSSDEDDDNSKRPRLASNGELGFPVVDEETRERIVRNQPKIILKQVGEVRHNGKLVPVFN